MRTTLTLYALAALAALFGPGPALPADVLSAVAALPLVAAGLGAANLVSGLFQGNKANKLRGEALDLKREDFRSREPLRAIALGRLQGLLGGPAPDLDAAFADPTNAFSAPVPRQAMPVGGGAPAGGGIMDRLGGGGAAPRAMPLPNVGAAPRMRPRAGAIPLRGDPFGPMM